MPGRQLRAGALALAAALLPAGPALAYTETGGMDSHGSTSLGPRATFYSQGNAEHARWAPGVQMRLRTSASASLELSADFVRYRAGGANVTSTPIQATMIGYFYPDASLSPYILIGGGWYPNHADGPYSDPYRLFGPHVGGGVEMLLGNGFSLDASYRYLWMAILTLNDYPLVHDLAERGHMFTVALNFRL